MKKADRLSNAADRAARKQYYERQEYTLSPTSRLGSHRSAMVASNLVAIAAFRRAR